MANELALRGAPAQEMMSSAQRTATEIVGVTRLVQEVMSSVMQDGQHYGKIPGCGDKPALLKPGAEKLCLTFRLAAMPDIQMTDMGHGHREYRVLTKLVHIPTGDTWGVGVGVCSTMESKYRYRGSARKCPSCQKSGTIIQTKSGRNPGGYWCVPDKGGCNSNFQKGDQAIEGQVAGKAENPDIADQYNTVLKMAKKRSLVDATLTAVAASDCFTQDLEELVEVEARVAPVTAHEPPPAPAAQAPAPTPEAPARGSIEDHAENIALVILGRYQAKDRAWNGRGVAEVHTAVRKVAAQRKRKADLDFYHEYLKEIDAKLASQNGDAK